MPCIEPTTHAPARARLGGALCALLLAGGCAQRPAPVPVTPAAATPAMPRHEAPGAARPAAAPTTPPVAAKALPKARSWDDYRQRFAQRVVEANPARSYLGPVPEPLLAIPVLEVDLFADGSIRHIDVLRHPTQARDTVALAIEAVRRAAPFGEVAHLPKPWRITETFLFDDERRFKPRTLDR